MKGLRFIREADELVRNGCVMFLGCRVALQYTENTMLPNARGKKKGKKRKYAEPRDFTILISRDLGPGQQMVYIGEALNLLEFRIKATILRRAAHDDREEALHHDGNHKA